MPLQGVFRPSKKNYQKLQTSNFFQLLRKCENSQITFLLQALPPQWTADFASTYDKIIMLAFARYIGIIDAQTTWKDLNLDIRQRLRIIRLPPSQGGFGLTANSDVVCPAYVHAFAESIRWIQSLDVPKARLQWLHFDDVRRRNFLVNEYLCAVSSICSIAPSGSYRQIDTLTQQHADAALREGIVLLPSWKLLLTCPDSDLVGKFLNPSQRLLAKISCKGILDSKPLNIPEDVALLLEHRKAFACSTTSSSGAFTHISKETWKGMKRLVWNPLAFISAIPDSSYMHFPKNTFAEFARMTLGFPSIRLNIDGKKCVC